MNGIHDMGGMHGMGPIEYEKDEPVFHQRWEARTFALTRALRFGDNWNLDASRHALEQLPAAEYLRMSYYEKWFVRLVERVTNQGFVTRAEIESGKPASGATKYKPVLTAGMVPQMIEKGASAWRDLNINARFASGQRVRARNMHPAGHTRLPRYARGKPGTIVRDHGVFVFPDTRAHFQGDKPQHVYSVRFDAQELWGSSANPRDAVYIDLWEDYLEPE
jgi:nitrile hydratase beta subunit